MPRWTNEQQQAITKEGTNIIVSAGAGSGKTAVLSERALRIVSSGIDVDRLLILTFTKAAAYEMMLRIRSKIKASGLVDQVEKIDSAYITTFDSFALSIVNKYHDLLNIESNVSIIDDSTISLLKQEQLDSIFDCYYLESNKSFENLINDFCLKDDKELKKDILKLNHELDMKYDRREYLENYQSNNFNNKKINQDIEEYEELLQSEIKKLDAELEYLSLALDGEYYHKLIDCLEPLRNSKTYDEISNNLNIKIPPLPRGSDDSVKNHKAELTKIINSLKKQCTFISREEIKETILMTEDYISIIIEILQKLDDQITNYKLEKNVYEFIDISKLAIKVVKEHPEVRAELKNYFHEIMIDEYQDTNDLQEEFINLISNNNVYMVGDIKQSIYRFRNANPDIFRTKYNDYANHNGGEKIDLNKNFRSRKEVLADINLIFDLVMDEAFGGATYKEGHQMIFGNQTYLEEGKTDQNYSTEIYNYEYDLNSEYGKDEIEAFIIAEDIENKIRNNYQVFDKDRGVLRTIGYNDFVILMDRSSKFDLYKKILEYKNIPLTILKDDNIMNHTEIYLIHNLLKLVIKTKQKQIDTEFKYSFLSIGRSYLYRYSDQELFDIIKDNSYFETDIMIKINNIVKQINELSLENIIDKLITEFNFYEKAITVGNIDFIISNLEYISNLANNLQNLDYTIEKFNDFIEKTIESGDSIKIPANSEAKNSVKMMTIHKSKGLEYHVCYYSGLAATFNVSDLKNKILFSNQYGIIVPYFKEGYGETIYKYLYKKKYYQEEISEKIRLFYVALTRCKEKMILVTNLKEQISFSEDSTIDDNRKLKYNSFLEILKSIYESITDFIITKEPTTINLEYKKQIIQNLPQELKDSKPLIQVLPELEIIYEIEEKQKYSKVNNKLFTENNLRNIELGEKLHYLFEIIDFKKPNLELLQLDDYTKNKILAFLKQPLLKDIELGTIYKEYEFTDNGSHGIIDCMIVYDDHVDIIDYKLKTTNDDDYRKQLSGYKEYIKKKINLPVNTYLYSIIEETLVKI